MVRRRGGLSGEDRELWERVARSTRPLRRPVLPARAPASPDPPDPVAIAPPPAAPVPPAAEPAMPRLRPQLAASVAVPGPPGSGMPGLDRRTAERLRRGRLEPQARLDLHGHSIAQAHSALGAFLRAGHARGLRCVLVITGKGRPREDDTGWQRRGILRESVPRWLALPPLAGMVVGVCPAHPRHGGGGAFYVYLRRARRDAPDQRM
ncbi:MAG: DNA mismatch repair protein MutS [Alphaproteobacteria bacterium]|nr:MAG: DNA mismatch repair protein MutS [Alphaproteobacteria bacterium]